MQQLYITLLTILFLFSCATKKVTTYSEPFSDTYTQSKDSIVFWRLDNLKESTYYSLEEMTPLSKVKRDYKIKNGKLYYKKTDRLVSNIKLQLRIDTLMGVDVKISNGLPSGAFCDFTNGITCKKDILYNEGGDLDGYYSVADYDTKFKNGLGYWKDFYYQKDTEKYTLKEEGKVKNNFKFGEWKYYNKEGEINSIKTYSLKDSVDLRFPHCIFNKNEPCY